MHHEQPSWVRDSALLRSQGSLLEVLSAVDAKIALLDTERRIVWASPTLVGSLGLPSAAPLLGQRPGDALGCVHSTESPLGCGSSPACYDCDAVGVILEARRTGAVARRQARVTVNGPQGVHVVELALTAAPWTVEGRTFTVLTVI